MISRKAVDPVSGEMSPVIGARLNPESRLVVPVTQASSAHRKPKPPPGALGLLEEEIVARRGNWRRQRQREMEVGSARFCFSQKKKKESVNFLSFFILSFCLPLFPFLFLFFPFISPLNQNKHGGVYFRNFIAIFFHSVLDSCFNSVLLINVCSFFLCCAMFCLTVLLFFFLLFFTISCLFLAVQEGAGPCSHHDVQPGHHYISQCPEVLGGH